MLMMNNTESVSAAPALAPVEGESERAFEAFRAYYDLCPRRRYAADPADALRYLVTIQINWIHVRKLTGF